MRAAIREITPLGAGRRAQDALTEVVYEHRLFRSALIVLESTIALDQSTWSILGELCEGLRARLDAHREAEERLAAACASALGTIDTLTLGVLSLDHALDHEGLERLCEVAGGAHRWPGAMQSMGRAWTEQFRRCLDAQDRQLLPLIERVLQSVEPHHAECADAWGLTASMTVNHVVRIFPSTRVVFESMGVQPRFEGSSCLDEVAWRRAMPAETLIRELARAIPREPDPRLPRVTVPRRQSGVIRRPPMRSRISSI